MVGPSLMAVCTSYSWPWWMFRSVAARLCRQVRIRSIKRTSNFAVGELSGFPELMLPGSPVI